MNTKSVKLHGDTKPNTIISPPMSETQLSIIKKYSGGEIIVSARNSTDYMFSRLIFNALN